MADTSLWCQVSLRYPIDDGKEFVLNCEARLSDHLGSSARRQKTNILLDQSLGQVKKARLVVDGDNRYVFTSVL